MNEFMGWWFPEGEDHFQRMLLKSVNKGGPARYQYQVRDLSLKYCTNRRNAIDIGANVGLWSRDLTQSFDHVIAFEPVELFRDCLKKNVQMPNFIVYPTALGNEDTTATMNITLGNMGHTHIDPGSIGQGTINVKTLDSYNFTNIDYIKMDCEGFEYRVIQGAEETIRRCQPTIVVEQKPHDAYSNDYSQFAAVDLLKSWGMIVHAQVKDDWILGWQ